MDEFKPFEDHVTEMRRLGQIFVPYTYPKVRPEESKEINVLRTREVLVDGYPIVLYYCKSDFGEWYFDTLHIFGKYSTFLPFGLVCKIAKKFLGDQHLSLTEVFSDGKRVYCWTVFVNRRGQSIPNQQKVSGEDCIFEGLEYVQISPKDMNFY